MTDYYVCWFVALWLCVRLTPQKMSPTQYARTVRFTDEVMCMVRYGTVRYGMVLYCTIRYRTVRYCTFTELPYGTVPYRTKNLELLERGEPDPI